MNYSIKSITSMENLFWHICLYIERLPAVGLNPSPVTLINLSSVFPFYLVIISLIYN